MGMYIVHRINCSIYLDHCRRLSFGFFAMSHHICQLSNVRNCHFVLVARAKLTNFSTFRHLDTAAVGELYTCQKKRQSCSFNVVDGNPEFVGVVNVTAADDDDGDGMT